MKSVHKVQFGPHGNAVRIESVLRRRGGMLKAAEHPSLKLEV
jgi:hypothetical protein